MMMNHITNYLREIMNELSKYVEEVSMCQGSDFIWELYNAPRIFLAGTGRSGLSVKAFANRLLHIRDQIYVVGNITTPPIRANDVIFIGSGSGETEHLINIANKANKLGATVIVNTANKQSALGQIANYTIVINSQTKQSNNVEKSSTIQPMGSLFEQLSFILYDSIILELMDVYDFTEQDMKERHANLE